MWYIQRELHCNQDALSSSGGRLLRERIGISVRGEGMHRVKLQMGGGLGESQGRRFIFCFCCVNIMYILRRI